MSSKQPRKQRRKQADQAHHQRRKNLNAHLTEDLLIKYDTRSLTVRNGDTVEVMRGSFKGESGKVMDVDPREGTLSVEGCTTEKADGTKVQKWIDASNVKITKLDLSDRLRRDQLGAAAEEAWEEVQAGGEEE